MYGYKMSVRALDKGDTRHDNEGKKCKTFWLDSFFYGTFSSFCVCSLHLAVTRKKCVCVCDWRNEVELSDNFHVPSVAHKLKLLLPDFFFAFTAHTHSDTVRHK